MEYDKPYKSFDELLDVLIKKHGYQPLFLPMRRMCSLVPPIMI